MSESRREVVRTCFGCSHYALTAGQGYCIPYEEPVISEIAAAADCPTYSGG